MLAFVRTASDRLRIRRGHPGSLVRGALTTAVLFGSAIAILLSGVGGSYALWNGKAVVNAGSIASGSISALESVTAPLTVSYKSSVTTTTGGLLVTNTGASPSTFSTTISLGSGSSAALAGAITVTTWQTSNISSCTSSAIVPGGATAGTWTSLTAPTATPLTGSLVAGAAVAYCLRTSMNVNSAAGIASGSLVIPTFTTTLSAGSTWTSTATTSATQTFVDDIAPSTPTALGYTIVSATSTTLSWTASTDNVAVVAYDVYRSGTTAAIGTTTSTSYTDTGVAAGTTYTYTVKARDAAANVSAPATLTVDRTPPSTPTLTVTAPTATSTMLTFSATDNIGVTAYDIYRNGAFLTTVMAPTTTYTDSVQSLATYTYTVTARDAAGNSSASSAPATITMPLDPNGWYSVANVSTGLCLDINGQMTTQGNSAIQWTCKTSTDPNRSNQDWGFTLLSGSTYTVSSLLTATSNPAYELHITAKKNGTVDLVTDDGSTAMQWMLTRLSNGNFTFENVWAKQCMTSAPVVSGAATPMKMAKCNSSSATQQFTLTPVASP